MLYTLTLALPLIAQQNMRLTGGSHFEGFGMAIAGLDDVDGDGLNDFVVGAFCTDGARINAGSTTVFSSADGHIISMPHGTGSDERLGHSIAACGDFNGDRIGDYVTGAYRHRGNGHRSGAIIVFDPLTGSRLLEVNGPAGSEFGWDVDSLGDINGDNISDILVGAWLEPVQGVTSGAGYVISGLDGSTIYHKPGGPGWLTGYSVANVGDLDRDGINDFAIGSTGANTNGITHGQVDIFSGATGQLIIKQIGDNNSEFGSAISKADDINQDGFPEYLITSVKDNGDRLNTGSYTLYDGKNHTVVWKIFGSYRSEEAGFSVSLTGDVDNDGIQDFLVGHPWSNMNGNASGLARVHSGANGNVIQSYEGPSKADLFGAAVAPLADINGDGKTEILIGSPNYGEDFSFEPGAVDLILSEPWLALTIPNPSSSGNTNFNISNSKPGATLHLFASTKGIGSDKILPAKGMFLDMSPEVTWIKAGSSKQDGTYSFSLPIPAIYAGQTLTFQVLEGRRNFSNPRRSNTCQITL